MTKTKVLLVEDHPYTAKGLAESLSESNDVEVVGVAKTAAEGLRFAQDLAPDVVMLDLHLPDSPPASDLIREFQKGQWKLIIFSGESRLAFVRAALDLGVPAFLLKSEPIEGVLSCIRSVHANAPGPIVSAELRRDLFSLPPSLEDILKLLAKGMKYEEIAEARHTTSGTIRQQCIKLQERIGLESREQLIAWAVANGYGSVG